jgi:hypothetical protein
MKRIALSTVALASILSLVGCSTGTTSTAPNNTVNRPSAPPGQSNSVSSAENDTGNTDRGSTNADSGSTVGMGNQNPTTSEPNAPPKTSQTSSFPTIVQMAMNRLPSDVRSWAYAPTMFPHTVLPGDTLFYRTMVDTSFSMSFPGREVVYNVWLNDKRGKMVSQFQGTQFDTAAHANSATLGGFGDVFGVNGQKSVINLNTGISGTAVVDAANNESHILWREGRWKINVSAVGTTKPPVTTANEAVAYLHTHFLPVPNTLGEISVTTNAGISTVMMTWQVGNRVFAVSTGEAAKQPMETALALAISMKKYQ